MYVQCKSEARSCYTFLCVCVCVCEGARGVGEGAWARACACAGVALISQHATRHHSHLRRLWVLHIFRRYLITGTIFGNKKLPNKCVF